MPVLMPVRGGCVIHRCQNKNPIERLTSGCELRHALEVSARRILKKSETQLSWDQKNQNSTELRPASEKTVGFRLLAQARPVAYVAGAHEVGGGWADDKARIERMCISLLMSKNL